MEPNTIQNMLESLNIENCFDFDLLNLPSPQPLDEMFDFDLQDHVDPIVPPELCDASIALMLGLQDNELIGLPPTVPLPDILDVTENPLADIMALLEPQPHAPSLPDILDISDEPFIVVVPALHNSTPNIEDERVNASILVNATTCIESDDDDDDDDEEEANKENIPPNRANGPPCNFYPRTMVPSKITGELLMEGNEFFFVHFIDQPSCAAQWIPKGDLAYLCKSRRFKLKGGCRALEAEYRAAYTYKRTCTCKKRRK